MASTGELSREIIWEGVQFPSMDHCFLTKEGEGWKFSGTLVVGLKDNSFAANYQILVDKSFTTKSLLVEKSQKGEKTLRKIELHDGSWSVDGQRRNDLHECVDVDLEASPCTNTLPIRRCRLKVGERIELTAAWVRLPSLQVVPLRQSYERKGIRTYLYRSSNGFTAELEVDEFGLVERYSNLWKELDLTKGSSQGERVSKKQFIAHGQGS